MASQRDSCGCKIGHTSIEYSISNLDSRLVEKWKNGSSVRQLAEDLNKEIIESELNAADVGYVAWSQTPVYEALHTDELSEAEEIEIRRELDRVGVNVEQLAADLVSHQTVYRHLTQCLNTSKEDDQTPDERREKAKNTVYALQQRTEAVTESTIDSLTTAGVTDLGDPQVLIDLQIVCNDCGQATDFETAINEGCNCSSP